MDNGAWIEAETWLIRVLGRVLAGLLLLIAGLIVAGLTL